MSNGQLTYGCLLMFTCDFMQMPSLNLEFLGNFLAELTLMEYSFLPYLPSLVAASAVFMAKLTLDSSTHPWVCRSPSCLPSSFDSR